MGTAMEELCKAQRVYTNKALNPAEKVTLTDSSRINSVRSTETTFPIDATEYVMGKKWERT